MIHNIKNLRNVKSIFFLKSRASYPFVVCQLHLVMSSEKGPFLYPTLGGLHPLQSTRVRRLCEDLRESWSCVNTRKVILNPDQRNVNDDRAIKKVVYKCAVSYWIHPLLSQRLRKARSSL